MPENKYHILVVDDLPDWRSTIKGLLNDAGYQYVEVAESKQTALDLLKTTTFDLAVLDMRLDETEEGNTEGLTLADEIRQSWPRVKIIMLTGYGTPDTQQKAMKSDRSGQRLAIDFISKLDTNSIVGAVKQALAQQP